MVETQNEKQFNYKDTLNLPTTKFPMKANLPNKEPEILAFWNQIDLYNLLQSVRKNDVSFILQDGPPYANGDIHLGHAFNRTLKDFVIKSKTLNGYKVPFVPGWDCHGLPIEIKVEKELNQQSYQVDPIIFIKKCREYAMAQVNKQKQQFIKLGLIADWDRPYITMDFKFEASVIRVLGKILANGHIVRGDRPVHWCVKCGSALAEAEVEYKDKQSSSVYVTFDFMNQNELFDIFNFSSRKDKDKDKDYISNNNISNNFLKNVLNNKISMLIWTTTPWTLPANQAVAINPLFEYCLIYIENWNRSLLVATNLIEAVTDNLEIKNYQKVLTFSGKQLENILLHHPLYNKLVPIVLSDHVTLDAGTGCVHIAPAHGHEDYLVGKKYNLPISNFINNRGYFLPNTELFANLSIDKAIPEIISILKNKGNILLDSNILHSYAHCWRHKTPLIYMATPQWFISMENQYLREKALESVQKTYWFPEWGNTRMSSMLQPGRPDWCISRQRIWGVPIPFFIHKQTGDLHPEQLKLLEVVAKMVELDGVEAWYKLDPKELLPEKDLDSYMKSTDILDVWFESGSVSCSIESTHKEMSSCADLYLEGSDQHRGWFQSSLLVSIAANNKSPFKQVLTHGFILDSSGNKMSKSLGNVLSPLDIINKYGADILRLWVATTDYSSDLKISEEILTRVSEGYRRIRNTARFLLANLHDFDYEINFVAADRMLLLDRKMLHTAMLLQKEIIQLYEEYKYHLIYQKVHNFCVEELGSFYLDIIKDRQYTCKANSIPRRSAQTALYYILQALVRWIAPILSFTAEEIWSYIPGNESNRVESIFLTRWFNNWPDLTNVDLVDITFWNLIFCLKKETNRKIEIARNNGEIGSSLEAEVTISCNSENFAQLTKIKPEIKFLLITSEVKLILNTEYQATDFEITIHCSSNPKCARCWHRVITVDQNDLCDRCKINLESECGEIRNYA